MLQPVCSSLLTYLCLRVHTCTYLYACLHVYLCLHVCKQQHVGVRHAQEPLHLL